MSEYSIEQMIKYGMEEATPFHKYLGVKVEQVGQPMKLSLQMKDEFIGNFTKKLLHGGVTATLLDLAGGSAIMYQMLLELGDAPLDEKLAKFATVGTIDLRVDYLRGGRGNQFFATADVVRYGNKIAVTKMMLHNEDGLLIATGTGTYIVG